MIQPRAAHTELKPKLLTLLQTGYSRHQFVSDASSGIVVAIVALPLAIAFAIASGVKPEQGLYTAIVAGFIIALLGGSRVQVSGPTGAFIVVIYGIVQQYGYDGLAVATLLAGFMLIAMGLARLGGIMKFVPFPVTIGFTSGIALIIFSSELRDFFGMQIQNMPADFIQKCQALWSARGTINFSALILASISLLIVIYGPKITRRVPSSLVAIFVATVLTHFFSLSVETIGSRFGSVPNFLPRPHLIHINLALFQQMFRPAMSIALLGAIESLLSAVVADGMIGGRHRSNMELVAQGVGNIISPFFLGIPATGAIARTVTNIKAGGRTPVAALTHSVVLLVIMLFFGHLAALVPMSALAAILVAVAWNMSERSSFFRMFHSTKSDYGIMLVTFLLTVFVDLSVAIEVGIMLGALLFMRSMTEEVKIDLVTQTLNADAEEEDMYDEMSIGARVVPPEVEVYEIVGPLFFGVVDTFNNAIQITADKPAVLILRMRNVLSIDASGLHAIEDIYARLHAEKITLVISGLKEQPAKLLERSGFVAKVGESNFCKTIDDALERAKIIVLKSHLSDQWF